MKVKYIAIEREFASGGTQIAKLCSEKCGINSYGKEIIEEVSKRVNIPVEDLEKYEQRVTGSFLYSMFLMNQSQTGNPDVMSNESKLFVAESKVIKDFVHAGNAIFVGHCATHILNDVDGVLKVFIHASDDFKRQRAYEKYNIPKDKFDSVCKQFDKKRANYYEFCTHKKWNDYSNYDLIIDTSKIGIHKSADMLATLID